MTPSKQPMSTNDAGRSTQGGRLWLLAVVAAGAVLTAVWLRNQGGSGESRDPGPSPAGASWRIPDSPADHLPAPTYQPVYPKPGDPEYADYQDMLNHPAYRISEDNHPASQKMPYDPEWRSLGAGRREAAPHDLGLLPGSAATLNELSEQWVFGVRNLDKGMLAESQVRRAEFLEILWPEFPQSRPYVRIPPDEAWFFHHSKLNEGGGEMLTEFGGRPLRFEAVQVTSVHDFTNFRILDVRVTALDEQTGQSQEITGPEGGSVVECRGRYKIYLYRN